MIVTSPVIGNLKINCIEKMSISNIIFSDSVVSAGSRGSDNVAPEIVAKIRSILDFDECCKSLEWTRSARTNNNDWMSNPLNNKFFYT